MRAAMIDEMMTLAAHCWCCLVLQCCVPTMGSSRHEAEKMKFPLHAARESLQSRRLMMRSGSAECGTSARAAVHRRVHARTRRGLLMRPARAPRIR